MRGTGGAGDGDAGGEAQPRAKGEDALAHPPFAAEQMSDAAEVEPEAVRAGQGGARRPAARGEQAQASEPGDVALGIGVAHIEAGDEHARLGQRHSRNKAERLRRRAGRGEDDALAAALGGDERADRRAAGIRALPRPTPSARPDGSPERGG